jgi:hypothetical protein
MSLARFCFAITPPKPISTGRFPGITASQQSKSLRCGILLLFPAGRWSGRDTAKRSGGAAFPRKHLKLGDLAGCG